MPLLKSPVTSSMAEPFHRHLTWLLRAGAQLMSPSSRHNFLADLLLMPTQLPSAPLTPSLGSCYTAHLASNLWSFCLSLQMMGTAGQHLKTSYRASNASLLAQAFQCQAWISDFMSAPPQFQFATKSHYFYAPKCSSNLFYPCLLPSPWCKSSSPLCTRTQVFSYPFLFSSSPRSTEQIFKSQTNKNPTNSLASLFWQKEIKSFMSLLRPPPSSFHPVTLCLPLQHSEQRSWLS